MDGNQDGSRKTRMVATVTWVVIGKQGKRVIGKGFLIYMDRGVTLFYLVIVYQKKNERFSLPELILFSIQKSAYSCIVVG